MDIFAELISPPRASLGHEPKIFTVRDRLVWCARSLKGGFDGHACEFVIELGIEAGLAVRDVTDIVGGSILGSRLSRRPIGAHSSANKKAAPKDGS